MKYFFAFLLAAEACLAADFNTGQAARIVIGQSTFTRSNPASSDSVLGGVGGVAYANNMLFVADANRFGSGPTNNRVLIFQNLSGTLPAPTDQLFFLGDVPYISPSCPVCRGKADIVLGQPDFTTVVQNLTQTGLRTPTAVASDGNIIAVADTDNNRILIWRSIPTTNGAPADVVIGQADFTHNQTSVPPTAKSLRGPQGVWIQNGRLYVADTQDNRILIYNTIPSSNNAAADVVLGQPDFTTFVEPDLTKTAVTPKPTTMQNPVAVTADSQRLYVTDLGHNRVLIWNSIPTQNAAPADVAVGQLDLNSGNPNDSTVLCPSNGTDTTTNTPTYPARCSKTLSFPRFALSDGKRLFIADGGNDRVLVYSTIPSASGTAADIILGQQDEVSDNSSDNSDAMQTPSSLAWDGTNLYVSDSYNRRILGFSVGEQAIPVAGVRNAASREIFALGTVTLGGTITENDTITITIGAPDANGTAVNHDYKYTVVKADTLSGIVQKLVDMINSAPDPNVVATANPTVLGIVLTARVGGQNGGNVTYSTTLSSNATITAATGGTTLSINLEDAAKIAPGTLVTISGTALSDGTASADLTGRVFAPTGLAGTEVYFDGIRAPLLYVSPTQINAQIPFEVSDRTSLSAYVRTVHADGSVTVTTPVAVSIVGANPGIFADEGTDPRPGLIYHAFKNDSGLVSVDGTIKAGDVATITIEDRPYAYTVVATDTLDSIRQALIALINANADEKVVASATNTFTRILLAAKGASGAGIVYTATASSGASVIMTALTPNLCCGNAAGGRVTAANPAVPGETLYLFATGLGVTNPPDGSDTGRIVDGSVLNPPAIPVDSILVGGKTANVVNVTMVPGDIGVYQVQFQLSSGVTTDPQTQMTIAQEAFVSNVVKLNAQAPPIPATLTFSVQPVDTQVNAVITPAIQVQALDANGAALPGAVVVISIGVNPGTGTLHGTLTRTSDSNGIATFNDLSIDTTGNAYQLTAIDSTGVTSAASNAFNVTPATMPQFSRLSRKSALPRTKTQRR